MGRKLSFFPDEEPEELIRRYESFSSRKGVNGYFDVEEFGQIVDYYLRKGDTEQSKEALEFGFRLHPGNPQLMVKRAKICLAKGDAINAYKILESTIIETDYEVLLLRIETLLVLGKTNQAVTICDREINNDIYDLDVLCLDFAYILLSTFEIEIAISYLKKGEKYNPSNKDLLFELAFAYEQLNQFNDAKKTYRKIIRIDPFAAEAWFNLGQIYFSRNDFSKALGAYEYAIAIQPDDSLSCLQIAHTYFQLNRFPEALEEYFEYQKLTGENWQTLIYIGETYEKLELFENAIFWYEKSYELKKINFDALTGIGICLLELERYHESLEYIRKAIEINSETPDVWVYLAEGLTGIEDNNKAFRAYQKSIELDPNQPETLLAIANICMEISRFRLAIFYYKEALEKDVNAELENIHLFIAVAYYKTGKKKQATRYLQKAIQDNAEAKLIFLEFCPDAVDLV